MAKVDPSKLWSLNYRLVNSVIISVVPAVAELGLEIKELIVLSEVDAHPYPAELAAKLCMPKPTITANLKRLEAAGMVRREIDNADLRRHRLQVTPEGRKAVTKGLALLTDAFGARLAKLNAGELAELKRLLEKMS
ncbi:MAG TPA: MarR family winged helix-turn-helix transcriptional regulator [Kofleriaceae bacterium]|nr:MarR family winged helix-turn-helix transcriptional regulator [Kofleriaceae bacterium]